jgi:hypothetical protein
MLEYVPGAHFTQIALPSVEFVPGGQRLHTDDPAKEKEPAAQGLHNEFELAPDCKPKVPALHKLQNCCPEESA